MNLNVEMSDATARLVRGHLEGLQNRDKKGAKTLLEIAVFEAVEQSLPIFYNAGDDVMWADEEWVVDSIVNGGSNAVVHSIDRSRWDVVACSELSHVEGLTG